MPRGGGETAEMPGLYRKRGFDLAGFGVAGVQQKDILDPAPETVLECIADASVIGTVTERTDQRVALN